jgi:hypothetical protein
MIRYAVFTGENTGRELVCVCDTREDALAAVEQQYREWRAWREANPKAWVAYPEADLETFVNLNLEEVPVGDADWMHERSLRARGL